MKLFWRYWERMRSCSVRRVGCFRFSVFRDFRNRFRLWILRCSFVFFIFCYLIGVFFIGGRGLFIIRFVIMLRMMIVRLCMSGGEGYCLVKGR